jgi:hypothetical protein
MTTTSNLYNIGDTVYFVINGAVDIVPAKVTNIHFYSPLCSTDVVSYDLATDHFNSPTCFQFVGESTLYSFLNAKAALLSWLNQQVADVTAITTPPVI